MKVTVDIERCQDHARCWERCPEVFALDEQGYAHVATDAVPVALEAKVREAVDLCPERAISVG